MPTVKTGWNVRWIHDRAILPSILEKDVFSQAISMPRLNIELLMKIFILVDWLQVNSPYASCLMLCFLYYHSHNDDVIMMTSQWWRYNYNVPLMTSQWWRHVGDYAVFIPFTAPIAVVGRKGRGGLCVKGRKMGPVITLFVEIFARTNFCASALHEIGNFRAYEFSRTSTFWNFNNLLYGHRSEK